MDKATDQTTFQKFVKDAVSDGEFTPDMPQLQRAKTQYLFVYGTLKTVFHHAVGEILREPPNRCVSLGTTLGDRFQMFNYAYLNYRRFPVVFPSKDPEHAARIYGEVYEIDPDYFTILDDYEANGTLYYREKILVKPNTMSHPVIAWMYFGYPQSFNKEYLYPITPFKPRHPDGARPFYIYSKAHQTGPVATPDAPNSEPEAKPALAVVN